MEIDVVEKFEVPRGTIFVCPAPFEMSRDKPEIAGQIIDAEGKQWLVTGVERFLPATPIRKGEMISLLAIPA